ncbi:MAG: ABC transporter ATP-binding protein, partial [Cyanobacteria bacterium Co-bin13]|nr:ABC transporter ATP-binding protein [Cyanobacteria bacterium Co-bin13]
MARSQLQKLGTYLRPHWSIAGLGIFALFIVNIVGVWIPLLIRNGIDDLQVTFSFNRVLYYVM